jgi:hypothetical protein
MLKQFRRGKCRGNMDQFDPRAAIDLLGNWHNLALHSPDIASQFYEDYRVIYNYLALGMNKKLEDANMCPKAIKAYAPKLHKIKPTGSGPIVSLKINEFN